MFHLFRQVKDAETLDRVWRGFRYALLRDGYATKTQLATMTDKEVRQEANNGRA